MDTLFSDSGMVKRSPYPFALVTGATGKLGPLLVSELVDQGWGVRIFVRSRRVAESALGALFFKVDVVVGDITDSESLLQAMSGIDVVFHLAALLHVNVPDKSLASEYERVNVEGTRHVIDGAQRQGVARMIFFSTVAVYGPGILGRFFHERSPLDPRTLYAVSKVKAERLVEKANRDPLSSPWITTLRLASVYGSRVTGNYKMLIRAVRFGIFCVPTVSASVNGKETRSLEGAYRTVIHEHDAVLGAILAATHPNARGRTFNVTDGNVHSLQSIIEAISHAMNRKVLLVKIPAPPLHRISRLLTGNLPSQLFRGPAGTFLSNVGYIMDKLMEDCRVDGRRMQSELGFAPQYNLERGWREAIMKIERIDRFAT